MTSAIGGLDYKKRRFFTFKERRISKAAVKWALESSTLSPNDLGRRIEESIRLCPEATVDQVIEARSVLLSSSSKLHGSYCLPRALAILYYCVKRFETRPQVVIGARVDPFQAHAWVRTKGVVVDEFDVSQYFEELRVY